MEYKNTLNGSIKKALVIEDDTVIEFVYRKFLERLGFHVYSVNKGLDAIEQAKKGIYDVMLLDLGLPDVSGEFVLCSIRTFELGTKKRLPIIINTAHGNDATLQACREQGADAVFQKPLPFETLQQCLGAMALLTSNW